MSTEVKKFVVGDVVAWGGASTPYIDEKVGRVIKVVPPGAEATWESLPEAERHGRLRAEGMPRNHESYLVRVGREIYWPRVKNLRPVIAPAQAPDLPETTP